MLSFGNCLKTRSAGPQMIWLMRLVKAGTSVGQLISAARLQTLPSLHCDLHRAPGLAPANVTALGQNLQPTSNRCWPDSHFLSDGINPPEQCAGPAVGMDHEIQIQPDRAVHGPVVFAGGLDNQTPPDRRPPRPDARISLAELQREK